MKPRKKRPITTGGAGYFPDIDLKPAVKREIYKYAFGDVPVDEIRKRLYRNILPIGYNAALSRTRNAVVNNKPDEESIYYSEEPANMLNSKELVRAMRDNIFAEYLQIPEQERRGIPYTKIVNSLYKPTKGAAPNVVYKKIDEDSVKDIYGDMWSGVYDKVYKDDPLNINQNKTTSSMYSILGKNTVGRGYDSKGEYMSYADVWDLSPYGFGGTGSDRSMGIGKPVHIYDRKYLDDYFGVPEPTHSTWLPEITIYPRKK